MSAIAYNASQSKTAGVSAGPTTFTVDVPTGDRLNAVILRTAANNKAVALTSVKPFLDKAQTVVGSAAYFVSAATSLPVATISLAITSTTRGDLYHVITHKPAAGGSLGPSAHTGIVSAYGFQVTVTCTASGGTGNWYFSAISGG